MSKIVELDGLYLVYEPDDIDHETRRQRTPKEQERWVAELPERFKRLGIKGSLNESITLVQVPIDDNDRARFAMLRSLDQLGYRRERGFKGYMIGDKMWNV